jgi:hypothetical protein
MMNCRLSRDPTVDGDTYADDVFVHEIDWHLQMDQIGSKTVITK